MWSLLTILFYIKHTDLPTLFSITHPIRRIWFFVKSANKSRSSIDQRTSGLPGEVQRPFRIFNFWVSHFAQSVKCVFEKRKILLSTTQSEYVPAILDQNTSRLLRERTSGVPTVQTNPWWISKAKQSECSRHIQFYDDW